MKKIMLNRDYTKFRFNGDKYSKGQLVLAVIQHYMTKHPKTTVGQLKEIFPRELQTRYPVIALLQDAKKMSNPIKRFFIKEDQIVKTKNGMKFAVTNYWGSENVQAFIDYAKKELRYKIQRVAA